MNNKDDMQPYGPEKILILKWKDLKYCIWNFEYSNPDRKRFTCTYSQRK